MTTSKDKTRHTKLAMNMILVKNRSFDLDIMKGDGEGRGMDYGHHYDPLVLVDGGVVIGRGGRRLWLYGGD